MEVSTTIYQGQLNSLSLILQTEDSTDVLPVTTKGTLEVKILLLTYLVILLNKLDLIHCFLFQALLSIKWILTFQISVMPIAFMNLLIQYVTNSFFKIHITLSD